MAYMNFYQYLRAVFNPYPSDSYDASEGENPIQRWGASSVSDPFIPPTQALLASQPFHPLLRNTLHITTIALFKAPTGSGEPIYDVRPEFDFVTDYSGAYSPYPNEIGRWVEPQWQAMLDSTSLVQSFDFPDIVTLMAADNKITTTSPRNDERVDIESVRSRSTGGALQEPSLTSHRRSVSPTSNTDFARVGTPVGFYKTSAGGIYIEVDTTSAPAEYMVIRLRNIARYGGATPIRSFAKISDPMSFGYVDVIVPMVDVLPVAETSFNVYTPRDSAGLTSAVAAIDSCALGYASSFSLLDTVATMPKRALLQGDTYYPTTAPNSATATYSYNAVGPVAGGGKSVYSLLVDTGKPTNPAAIEILDSAFIWL